MELKDLLEGEDFRGMRAMVFRTKNHTYVVHQYTENAIIQVTEVSQNEVCSIGARWNLDYDGGLMRFRLYDRYGREVLLTTRIVDIVGLKAFSLGETSLQLTLSEKE